MSKLAKGRTRKRRRAGRKAYRKQRFTPKDKSKKWKHSESSLQETLRLMRRYELYSRYTSNYSYMGVVSNGFNTTTSNRT